MHPSRNDIGAYVLCTNSSISIQETDASVDINGTSVDGARYGSCVVVAQAGAASGAPSAQSLVFQVQESSDDSTWTSVSGQTLTVDADNEILELDIDLRERQRYIRVILDASESSFTGGSTPANDIAAHVVLGGKDELPV